MALYEVTCSFTLEAANIDLAKELAEMDIDTMTEEGWGVTLEDIKEIKTI